MRIAIVTPYSWTYPGGVNRHVEALAEALIDRGHELRVLAPWDPPDRLSQALHRAPAEKRSRPDYLIPLGRTVGIGANGAVSNLSVFPDAVTTMRRELHAGRFDVVHVHEPPAPVLSWDACSFPDAPVVGTFHAYSTKRMPNWIANLLGARRKFNQLQARIAVSEAAAWTGRRWFGGEYRVIPNGVDVDAPPLRPKPRSDELRLLFVGRPEERKGLPVLRAGVRGADRARARAFDRDRRRAGGRAALPDRSGCRVADRGAWPGRRRGAVAPPARGRRALRALAGRRELRHGADGGVRGRHAGDRLRDRGVLRRGHRRRRRRAGAAGRPPAARRGAPADLPRAGPPRVDGPRRHAKRPLATPGRASPSRSSRSTRRPSARSEPATAATRLARRAGVAPIDGGPAAAAQAASVARPGARPGGGAPPRRQAHRRSASQASSASA